MSDTLIKDQFLASLTFADFMCIKRNKLVLLTFQVSEPVHKEIQQDTTVYQNFISYLYESQHVSGDTPPIIRSLKLH